MKVKTYRIMESGEFDAFVKSVYGDNVRYEFVADEEAHNYTSVTYDNMVRGKELGSYESGKLSRMVMGDSLSCGFMAQTLIQDMVNNKVLDPGNYMIEVFW